MEKNKKNSQKKNSKDVIKSNMEYYRKDPFFLKKDKASVEFLTKHGFPEETLKRK